MFATLNVYLKNRFADRSHGNRSAISRGWMRCRHESESWRESWPRSWIRLGHRQCTLRF